MVTLKARDRIARLPQEPGETWQGAFAQIPAWVNESGRKPYRPVGFFWTSVERGQLGACEDALAAPGDEDPAMALDALVEFATKPMGGRRPARVEVRDEDAAAFLTEALAGMGIQVVHRTRLEALDEALSSLFDAMGEDVAPPPGYLDGKGMTVERVRSFADAAQTFYEAALWRHLSNDDLIRVEAPKSSTAPKYAMVFGAGGYEFGLGFFRSTNGFWTVHSDPDRYYREELDVGMWSFTLCPIMEIPLADALLWEQENLPLANDEAYPLAMRIYTSRIRRLSARALSFLEGLLRTLGATTEDDLVQGRWTKTVETFDGAVEYRLSLPMLLDPPHHSVLYQRGFHDRRAMESLTSQTGRFLDDKDLADLEEMNEALQAEFTGKRSEERKYPPRTPLEEAQDLCYEAFDSIGYRRVVLARRAIEISGDCADAYVLLAEATTSPEERATLYASGVEAGKRALGEEFFAEDLEHPWGRLEARPFLRAMEGVAETHAELGRVDRAIATYRELLRLNPDDNQGNSYSLLPLLIVAGHDEEAEELVAEYGDDSDEAWAYARALLAYRKHGDAPESRKRLRKAIARNPHVRTCLLEKGRDDRPPTGTVAEDREEAFLSASHLQRAWDETPGALEWLETEGRAR